MSYVRNMKGSVLFSHSFMKGVRDQEVAGASAVHLGLFLD
jgi:hypothetical protein